MLQQGTPNNTRAAAFESTYRHHFLFRWPRRLGTFFFSSVLRRRAIVGPSHPPPPLRGTASRRVATLAVQILRGLSAAFAFQNVFSRREAFSKIFFPPRFACWQWPQKSKIKERASFAFFLPAKSITSGWDTFFIYFFCAQSVSTRASPRFGPRYHLRVSRLPKGIIQSKDPT